jgi:DNA-directed RNA polymerase subunit omega
MARVTVEDCLEQTPNRFSLIHLAFQRVKHLRSGDNPKVQSKNKEVVVALREIAAGGVEFSSKRAMIPEMKETGSESEQTGGRALPA